MKDKHPIDDLFRERLSSRKLAAPASAWNAIENNIEQKSHRPRTIYLISAIAASICLLCAATWIVTGNDSEPILTGQIHQVNKKSLSEVALPTIENISLSIDFKVAKVETLQVLVTPSEEQTPEISIVPKEELSIGIQQIDKKLVISSVHSDELTLTKPQLTLPSYAIYEDAPKGMRFRFIRGVVSMAKGVQNGRETLSGLRKSKIEFIQEDLKYGSEKESEEEATIDQDSPSYQK